MSKTNEVKSVLVDQTGKTLTADNIKPRKELAAAQVTTIVDNNPYVQMIAVAAAKDVDVEKLEKLMDLQERWEERQAKKEYLVALAAFSEDTPVVTKDKKNAQFDSMYASLENTTNTLARHLAIHGLKHRWVIDQTADISVTCVLSHVGGYSDTATMIGPPDISGKKNAIQQIKSTITYLKLATLESVTGTASAAGSFNDDGNSATAVVIISPEDAASLRDELATLDGDEKYFCDFFRISCLEEMLEKDLTKAKNVIKEQKRARS